MSEKEGTRIKVFAGSPKEIQRQSEVWMGGNEGKVGIVSQVLKMESRTGGYSPEGALSIVYNVYRIS